MTKYLPQFQLHLPISGSFWGASEAFGLADRSWLLVSESNSIQLVREGSSPLATARGAGRSTPARRSVTALFVH
jgi:hypothetical protein